MSKQRRETHLMNIIQKKYLKIATYERSLSLKNGRIKKDSYRLHL